MENCQIPPACLWLKWLTYSAPGGPVQTTRPSGATRRDGHLVENTCAKAPRQGGSRSQGGKQKRGAAWSLQGPPPQGLPTPAGVAGSPRICRGEASRDRRAGQDPPQSGAPLSVPSSGRAQSKHSRPHKLMPGIRWLGRWRDSGNLLKVQCLPEDSTHVLSR